MLKLRKKITIFLILVMTVSLSACGSSAPVNAIATDTAAIGDCTITIESARFTKESFSIKYKFTNEGAQTKSFDDIFHVETSQNGKKLEGSEADNTKTDDSPASKRKILKGKSIEITKTYPIKDKNNAPVIVDVLDSRSNFPCLSKTFTVQ